MLNRLCVIVLSLSTSVLHAQKSQDYRSLNDTLFSATYLLNNKKVVTLPVYGSQIREEKISLRDYNKYLRILLRKEGKKMSEWDYELRGEQIKFDLGPAALDGSYYFIKVSKDSNYVFDNLMQFIEHDNACINRLKFIYNMYLRNKMIKNKPAISGTFIDSLELLKITYEYDEIKNISLRTYHRLSSIIKYSQLHDSFRIKNYWKVEIYYAPSKWMEHIIVYKKGKVKYDLKLVRIDKKIRLPWRKE